MAFRIHAVIGQLTK